ncbi:MAG: sodium:calcium antiporter [Actinomycetota bacterium]|nr:sodium:calcium antiporter [Actinomycetota bacterium]
MPGSLAPLVLIFVAAAAGVWIAGIWLSRTTDVLANRFDLGEALGGSILLAFTTNLPEIAITFSAALAHSLGIAIGNILGGIAIQTVVLAVLDVWGLGRSDPLTYRAASLQLVLEAALVVAVLVVVVMGTQVSPRLYFERVEPAALLILVIWVVGLWLVGHASRGLPWHEQGNAPGGQEVPRGTRVTKTSEEANRRGVRTGQAALVFAGAAVVTLVGGVLLERSGEKIAGHIGMTGVVFGATVLAAATALPEVSTGLASVRMRDYQLAVSDIFGGNAFLPVLFLFAALLSGDSVLPTAHKTDIYLTALGALLTVVYIFGLIFRPRRQVVALGVDSALVVALYALGIVGLVFVSG